MKTVTKKPLVIYKYLRILNAQNKLYKEIEKLYFFGDDWKKQRNKEVKLNSQMDNYENKLKVLVPKIRESDFVEYLENILCCKWEDFTVYTFESFMHSDNVIKTIKGYTTQCSQYSIFMTLEELEDYYKKNY